MCGRAYSTYTEEELEIRYRNQRPLRIPKLVHNYNLSPTQESPIVQMLENGERLIELAAWGLIPAWAPEFKTKLSTINAKSETVFESKLYGGLIRRRRCIVPLSGFIEWKSSGPKMPKRPFKIWQKDEPIMSLAGVWDSWKLGTPEEKHSFSILTTQANELMSGLHHRMPVILERKDEGTWLDSSCVDPMAIAKLLRPLDSAQMVAVEISPAINSPRNNRPELLEPFTSAQFSLL